MSQLKNKTRFMMTTAALTLWPALAMAQDNTTSENPPRAISTPTEFERNSASSPSQAGIDPAEVQKVFGMEVGLIDLKSLDKDQITRLQQTLQERGHYLGSVDGIVGPKTRSALTAMLAEQFSLNQRLVNQGQITQQLASSMGIDARGRTPVSGVDMSALPRQPQAASKVPAPAPAKAQRPQPAPVHPPMTDETAPH